MEVFQSHDEWHGYRVGKIRVNNAPYSTSIFSVLQALEVKRQKELHCPVCAASSLPLDGIVKTTLLEWKKRQCVEMLRINASECLRIVFTVPVQSSRIGNGRMHGKQVQGNSSYKARLTAV